MSTELPAWMQAQIDRVSTALGLDHTVTLYFRLAPTETAGTGAEDQHQGYCENVPRYHYARIQFTPELVDDATGYETVTHELLHAALWAQEQAARQIISLLPKELRKAGCAIWQDGNEAAISQVAATLAPILREDPTDGRQTEDDHAGRPAPD